MFQSQVCVILFSNVIYYKTCYKTHCHLSVETDDLTCNCTCSIWIFFHVAFVCKLTGPNNWLNTVSWYGGPRVLIV